MVAGLGGIALRLALAPAVDMASVEALSAVASASNIGIVGGAGAGGLFSVFSRSGTGSSAELMLGAESRILKVSTGGLRNEVPLTSTQKAEIKAYVIQLGISEESIIFSDNMNTSYKMLFGAEKLYIGTDVLPAIGNGLKANSRVSWRGAIAHEIVGHREAELAQMSHPNLILEEAQASIRAARYAPDLTSTERYTLLRDGLERLRSVGIQIRDVKNELWIDEHAMDNSLRRK